MTGIASPYLASFDEEMTRFMKERGIPAAALAVTRKGKLVLARGYGHADRAGKRPTPPQARFRIASISKPITAVAVLKLIEESRGGLTLDTKIRDILEHEPHLSDGATVDSRWNDVTIRHCLWHTGGWDRGESFDPMFRPGTIAKELGVKAPAGSEAIIRYMLGQPLDFDPGERHAYSNFGYCLLGRVIEQVSGQPYDAYVKQRILRPLGIRRMRVGRTRARHRARGEVWYSHPTDGRVESVFPDVRAKVEWPNGGFYLEPMDSHGAWIASAVDLVRFASAFDDLDDCQVLSRDSVRTMFERPPGLAGHDAEGKPKRVYYGLGWYVRPVGKLGRSNQWHGGSLPGTHTLLVRRWDGYCWAVLFNQRKDASGLRYGEIDPAMHRATRAVKQWPDVDLFARFR